MSPIIPSVKMFEMGSIIRIGKMLDMGSIIRMGKMFGMGSIIVLWECPANTNVLRIVQILLSY